MKTTEKQVIRRTYSIPAPEFTEKFGIKGVVHKLQYVTYTAFNNSYIEVTTEEVVKK